MYGAMIERRIPTAMTHNRALEGIRFIVPFLYFLGVALV